MTDEATTPERTELVQPVIDHAEKIANITAAQTAAEERLNTRINEAQTSLREAIDQSATGYSERISALENALLSLFAKQDELEQAEAEATPPEPETPAAPAAPDVEVPKPEKQYKTVRRNGRKVKREV